MNFIAQIENHFSNRKHKICPKSLSSVLYGDLHEGLGFTEYNNNYITEISGEAGSGKTLLALYLIKQLQFNTAKIIYIDVYRNFNKDLAIKLGIYLEHLLILYGNKGTEINNIITYIGQNHSDAVIIIDSISAVEFESLDLELLCKNIQNYGLGLIFISEIRQSLYSRKIMSKIDKRLKILSLLRLRTLRAKQIIKNKELIAIEMSIEILKNQINGLLNKFNIIIPIKQINYEI